MNILGVFTPTRMFVMFCDRNDKLQVQNDLNVLREFCLKKVLKTLDFAGMQRFSIHVNNELCI